MSDGRRALILIALFLAMTATAVLYTWRHGSSSGRILEVRLRTSAGTAAQLAWDAGTGFDARRSIRLPLARTPDDFQVLRFTLPEGSIRSLRLEPTDRPGEVLLDTVRVLDADGGVIRDVNPRSLIPASQIASMKRAGRLVQIDTDPAATDPSLAITAACLERPSAWYNLTSVTPFSLTVAGCAFLILILGSAAAIAIGEPGGSQGSDATRNGWSPVMWLGTLFFVALAAKLLLIFVYPAPVPYLDQWDAEAAAVYLPFHDGCLPWQQMAGFHNEHRVFFTRLLALGLLEANGQWDPQLQQVVNAGMHAGTGVLVATMLWRAAGRRRLDYLVLMCGVMFALPFSWENTLSGFQSAFYFLLLFFVLSLGLTVRRVRSPAWCLGWLCVFCDLFTAAGGLVTPVAVGAVALVRFLSGRSDRRELSINAGMTAIALATGIYLTSPPIEAHAYLKAATFQDFMTSLGRNLAWPWVDAPRMWLLVWLPAVTLTSLTLLRPRRATGQDVLIVGLGCWVVLQAGLLAYARGAGAPAPASRYMDILSFGLLTNAAAVTGLVSRLTDHPAARRIALAGLVCWSVWGIAATEQLSARMLPGAAARAASMVRYERILRGFVIDDDLPALAARRFPDIPHYSPVLLANAWLRHPFIRRILPAAIRAPLHVDPPPAPDSTFVANGVYPTTPLDPLRHARGSYNGIGNPAQGRFESAVLECDPGSYLSFDLAGYLGRSGLSLGVVGADGRELRVRPAEAAMETWVPSRVRCPDRAFTIRAVDATPELWFAFAEPIEVAWASALAEAMVQHATGLLIASLGAALIVARFA